MRTIVCDIDGVLADLVHRLGFIQKPEPEWDAFFEACDGDSPIIPMVSFLREISPLFAIHYLTGRPERTRDKTLAWFQSHGIPMRPTDALSMRSDGDHRHDHIVKSELFDKALLQTASIGAVFEDRDSVVEMWRGRGLLCLQPRKGDF